MKPLMLRFLLFFTCFMTSFCAYAGGNDWNFSIKNFTRHGDSYSLTLNAVSKKEQPMGCEALHVAGRYAWMKWQIIDRGSISRIGHRAALDYLEKSRSSNAVVRFGVIGDGLLPVKSKRCHFESRGLISVMDRQGQAVFSIYYLP
jgi:hypothetical protein